MTDPYSTNQIRTLIVEDNPHALANLVDLLLDIDNIAVIGKAADGKKAVELINEKRPDLVFLDIELPGMDGFEILKTVQYKPSTIFVTAHDVYAVKAFEANGIDYLLKPVSEERLRKAVNKVLRVNRPLTSDILRIVDETLNKKRNDERFAVKLKNQILIVPQEEVYYFNAEDKYVFLNTEDNSYFYNTTLKKLASTLDPKIFQRINKSNIVSLNKIVKLKKTLKRDYLVVLSDQKSTSIKVSRNYLTALKRGLDI